MHLERLLAMAETIAASGRAISATEIQHSTNLPKPTCYRLLRTLMDHGLVEKQHSDGLYRIGRRFTRIALMGLTDTDVKFASIPHLKTATGKFGQAFFLSRERNGGVEIIHVEEPEDNAASFVHPGLGFRPLHACSCSKAIAAFSDSELHHKALSGRKKSYTPNTKTNLAQIQLEFEKIRSRGYAECVEEIELGICSVAAPVFLDGNSAPFSIGATGSIHQLDAKQRKKIGSALTKYATEISANLRANTQ